MNRGLTLLLIMQSLFSASFALAAGSEVANRNLGVNAKQVARVQEKLEPSSAAASQAASSNAGKAQPANKAVPTSASDIRIERIEAYASNIEELEGPAKPPLQKFSERLEADRPMTPAEKAQMLLSFFLGGPPGKEPTPEQRTEARVARGGTMLATPRGSLQ